MLFFNDSPFLLFLVNFLLFHCPLANAKIWAREIRKGKSPKSQYFNVSVTLFKRFDFFKMCSYYYLKPGVGQLSSWFLSDKN